MEFYTFYDFFIDFSLTFYEIINDFTNNSFIATVPNDIKVELLDRIRTFLRNTEAAADDRKEELEA